MEKIVFSCSVIDWNERYPYSVDLNRKGIGFLIHACELISREKLDKDNYDDARALLELRESLLLMLGGENNG